MSKAKWKTVRWEIEISVNENTSPERAAFDALRIMSGDERPLTFSVLSYNQEGTDRRDINLDQYAFCDNCGEIIFMGEVRNKLAEIKDLFRRVDPGGMVPSCDCPQCGALAYPASKMVGRKE